MRYHSPKRRQSTLAMRRACKIIAVRCSGMCEHCGQPLPIGPDGAPVFVPHHRKARTQGGQDTPDNLLAVLATHHTIWPGSIHQEPAQSQANGWIVPRSQDPATTPVLIAGRWSLLGADGGVQAVDEVA